MTPLKRTAWEAIGRCDLIHTTAMLAEYCKMWIFLKDAVIN